MLLAHAIVWALPLALPRAGKSNPARMAMIAITTSSSMSVNAAVTELRRGIAEGLAGTLAPPMAAERRLLVAQRIDRVEVRGLVRRVKPKENPNSGTAEE